MISGLVLAAGEGRRLGVPKALAVLEGQSFLERVVRTLASSTVDEIVVACGARASDVEELAAGLAPGLSPMPLRVVRHDGWATGRSGTIRAAWSSCAAGSHALVFPVDHPLVRLTTLDAMLGVHGYATRDIEVIVPVVEHGGARRRGHPILLSAALRDEVLSLADDAPLRDVVHRHAVLEVPVDDEGVLLDIDDAAGLAAAAARLRP